MNTDNNTDLTEEQVEGIMADQEVAEVKERIAESKSQDRAALAQHNRASLNSEESHGAVKAVHNTKGKVESDTETLANKLADIKPGEFQEVSEGESKLYRETAKTLGNTDQNPCRKNVSDVIMFGDDLFKLLSKASSETEGWMKSTKAMDTGKGCVIQVTTQQRNPDGTYEIAEALTYVSGVTVVEQFDEENKVIGRRLKGVR